MRCHIHTCSIVTRGRCVLPVMRYHIHTCSIATQEVCVACHEMLHTHLQALHVTCAGSPVLTFWLLRLSWRQLLLVPEDSCTSEGSGSSVASESELSPSGL